jgi:hypothetical protein
MPMDVLTKAYNIILEMISVSSTTDQLVKTAAQVFYYEIKFVLLYKEI